MSAWAETFISQFNDPACSSLSGLIVGEWFAIRFLWGTLLAYFAYKGLKKLIIGRKNSKTIGFEVKK